MAPIPICAISCANGSGTSAKNNWKARDLRSSGILRSETGAIREYTTRPKIASAAEAMISASVGSGPLRVATLYPALSLLKILSEPKFETTARNRSRIDALKLDRLQSEPQPVALDRDRKTQNGEIFQRRNTGRGSRFREQESATESGGEAFAAMVQATDFRNGDNSSNAAMLNWAGLGAILIE